MKTRELLLTGVLLVAIGYAGWMQMNESRVQTELATLRAAHMKLQERHGQMRHALVELATLSGMGKEEFRKLAAALEADGGADVIMPTDPETTRINKPSGILVK